MARAAKETARSGLSWLMEEHIAKVHLWCCSRARMNDCPLTPIVQQLKGCVLKQVWNMAYYSGLVCIAPYMNVYYKRLNVSERQIGILAALSPWVNASSGNANNSVGWRLLFIASLPDDSQMLHTDCWWMACRSCMGCFCRLHMLAQAATDPDISAGSLGQNQHSFCVHIWHGLPCGIVV